MVVIICLFVLHYLCLVCCVLLLICYMVIALCSVSFDLYDFVLYFYWFWVCVMCLFLACDMIVCEFCLL